MAIVCYATHQDKLPTWRACSIVSYCPAWLKVVLACWVVEAGADKRAQWRAYSADIGPGRAVEWIQGRYANGISWSLQTTHLFKTIWGNFTGWLQDAALTLWRLFLLMTWARTQALPNDGYTSSQLASHVTADGRRVPLAMMLQLNLLSSVVIPSPELQYGGPSTLSRPLLSLILIARPGTTTD